MAVLGSFVMQPADEWEYDIVYREWLTPSDGLSDQVAPVVAVVPEGLEVGAVVRDYDNKAVRVWLSGGADGTRYKVEVTTRTSEGRTRQDEFYVTVRDF